jgi:hypothetical protein
MGRVVKLDRIIPVQNLDMSWAKLDTSRCISVKGYDASAYYLDCFIHKTRNKRWYVEEYDEKTGKSEAEEVHLDGAMDWLLDHTYSPVKELRYLEDLPNVAETPIPAYSGTIVVNCLKCRALSRIVNTSRSKTERAIVSALKKAKLSLSGPEIAVSASLKYNANFRAMLARLVSRGFVRKFYGKGGYVLPDKYLS